MRESKYESEFIQDTAARLRIPVSVYLAFAWIVFGGLYLYSIFGIFHGGNAPSKSEFYADSYRMAVLLLVTVLHIISIKTSLDIRNVIGYGAIWLVRVAVFPMNLFHELGVHQYSVHLIMMQVLVTTVRDLNTFQPAPMSIVTF